MRNSFLIVSLTIIVSCSSDRASMGNSGVIPGNSDKKNHGVYSEMRHEEVTEDKQKVTEPFYFNSEKVKLTFTAYKLPGEKKQGVNGYFKTINVTEAKQSDIIEEVLSNTSFSISTASLSTNDSIRDQKLKEFFFEKLINTAEITGSFGELKDGRVPITLKLNDKVAEKDFQYQVSGRQLTIVGKIDIIDDFGASEALKSINEACNELHEGKTWSDVDLKAEIEL